MGKICNWVFSAFPCGLCVQNFLRFSLRLPPVFSVTSVVNTLPGERVSSRRFNHRVHRDHGGSTGVFERRVR